MLPKLHLDFETRSLLKLGRGGVGLYRYAEHLTTSIWCFAYRFGLEGPVSIWWRDEPLPTEVVEHVRAGGTIVAHNAGFERRIWNVVLNRMMNGHLPQLEIGQMDCTAARARALGLPGDLERAAKVVRAPHQKDVAGGNVMKKMAAPRSVSFVDAGAAAGWPNNILFVIEDTLEHSLYMTPGGIARIDWNYDAALRTAQTEYCKTDVLAETGVDTVTTPLSDRERRIWQLNERINDRGFPLDLPLVDKVQAVVDTTSKRANRRIWTITNGAVKKCSDHGALKKWLEGRGIKAYVLKNGEYKQSVGKGVTEDLLTAATNDPLAREAIDLHSATARVAYASKIGKARTVINSDGHLRGVFQYHTAPTGRFSAVNWQAHNLMRVDEEMELPTLRELIKICERFDADLATDVIDLATGKTLFWMPKMSRPIIKARKGRIFRGADLSNIEGRTNAWTAGETWKLEAFRAFDAKIGPDLYKVTAGNILNVAPAQVTKAQRQTLGKVPDLAGGFQGSVMAYVSMGVNLGVDPTMIAGVAAETTDPKVWAATAKSFRPRFSCGLEQSVWTGIKVVVNAWRSRHPEIVQSWWDRQDAATAAVSAPGSIQDCCGGRIRYMSQSGFLWCMLPTGRLLAYPQPEMVRVKYIKEEKQEIDGVEVTVEVEAYKNAVQVWGLEKNQWAPYTLYGGIQCENDTQAIARDVFCDGGLDLDALGYNLIFHCHDEWLSEDDPNFGSTEEMVRVLSMPRSYAPGLPLAAAAWEDERYVK